MKHESFIKIGDSREIDHMVDLLDIEQVLKTKPCLISSYFEILTINQRDELIEKKLKLRVMNFKRSELDQSSRRIRHYTSIHTKVLTEISVS